LERIVQIRERDGVKVKTLPLIVDLDAQYLIQKADAHMHGLPGITGTPVLNGVHQRLGERQVEVVGEGMAITGIVIEFMGDLLANFPYKPKIPELVWNGNVHPQNIDLVIHGSFAASRGLRFLGRWDRSRIRGASG